MLSATYASAAASHRWQARSSTSSSSATLAAVLANVITNLPAVLVLLPLAAPSGLATMPPPPPHPPHHRSPSRPTGRWPGTDTLTG